jgi:hypothetical protein
MNVKSVRLRRLLLDIRILTLSMKVQIMVRPSSLRYFETITEVLTAVAVVVVVVVVYLMMPSVTV